MDVFSEALNFKSNFSLNIPFKQLHGILEILKKLSNRMGKNKRGKAREPTSSTSSIETSPAPKVTKMADEEVSKSDPTNMKEYMKIQQDCFKSFVDTLMNNFSRRLDDLSREIQGIKCSLEYTQKDVDDVQNKLKNVSNVESEISSVKKELKSVSNVEAEISSMKKEIEDNQDKLDYLENQSRRSNVRISGIDEQPNESWDDTEVKVKEVLEKMDIPSEDVDIERAHRTGRPNQRARQIVVKFLRYKDRENVLKSGKKLKGTGIYVNEDLSSRVIKRRYEQQDKLMEARRAGKIAYFNVDRLIVKNRPEMPSHFGSFGAFGAVAAYRSPEPEPP